MSSRVVRYSEAFKRQVVLELEDGTSSSIEAVSLKYGIGGHGTVARWIRKYGRNHLLPKVVRVETPDERTELQIFKARIRDLEKALADTQMDALLYRAHFELACEELGQDPKAKKKVLDAKRSSGCST